MIKGFNFFCWLGFSLIVCLWSCSDDEIAEAPSGPPVISLGANSSDLISVKPSQEFVSLIGLRPGKSLLRGLTFLEKNQLIQANRIKINGKQAFGNPVLLSEDQSTGGNLRIDLKAQNEVGLTTYTIILHDLEGASDTVSREIQVGSNPPKLKYNGPSLNIAIINKDYKYKVSATKGTGKMKSLRVFENGNLIEINRLLFDGKNVASNPFDIDVLNQNLFDKDLTIKSPSKNGDYLYKFLVEDEFGAIGADSAYTLVGIPLTEFVSKTLFNAAKGGNFGGMSFIFGNSVGINNLDADIVDLGVDSTNTDKNTNWLRQIKGVNGVELKQVIVGKNGVPLSFAYTFMYTKEQLEDLWSKSTSFTQKDKGGALISDRVQVGQIFIAKKGSSYVLIEVAGVINSDTDEDYLRLNFKL